ncbi:myelin P2 protein [Eurytemora carolleeae]|uniref:myelin P2 protein n=1 Tax=Eurytemora carolleeae TaxID=1294199 RepID=UPI000C77AC02|nr:myelin P2 protein [Eurytemora carolleeae]|eukprot:XP_023338278.1 myelin P2 protein-like [Eurytemora affinis]
MMKVFFLGLCLACLSFAADGPLPEYILGEYKYESSENYDEFLTDLGLNWFTRQIIQSVNPRITISQGGGKIKLTLGSSLFSSTSEFELGVPFMEKDPRGGNVPAIATFAGNSLKKVLTPTEDPAYTEIRTFTENGKRMTVTLSVVGSPITATRYFQKV